jgi:hypothetical protein
MDRKVQLLICILMILVPTLAVADPAESPRETPGYDYTTAGECAPGYLNEEWVPSTWPEEDAKALFERIPVVLNSYLPYPNPYSHPMAFVGVGRTTDFRLVTRDRSGKIIDTFGFTGVAPGFYKFTCGRMLPSTEMVTVVLWWDEKERGRTEVQEKVLVSVK